MSYTLYHGCIKSAVEAITHGKFGNFDDDIVHPWTVSDGESIFFHDAELMKKSECIYDDDNETAIQYCIERCNEQAQIQNACLAHPFDTTCVLEVTFLGDEFQTWEDICVPDDSCPNMTSAVCMWSDTFNDMVMDGKIKFVVHEFEFFPKLALCYIAGLATTNPLFSKECLSRNELKACEFISNAEIFIDELCSPMEIDNYEIEPSNSKEH